MKYVLMALLIMGLHPERGLASAKQPQLPPSPFLDTPVAKVPATLLTEFAPPYFLECAHSRDDGRIVFTSHNDGRLYVRDNGENKVIADVAGKMTCLEPIDSQRYLITGWDQHQQSVLFIVSLDGKVETIHVSEGQFLNGVVALDSRRFLIADSFKGVIWQYDIQAQSLSIWLDHPLLKKQSPEQAFPGINGLQRQGNSIYFANNARMLLGKIQLDHKAAGAVSVHHESVLIDDFAVDQDHTIYGATHIYHSIVRITAEGERTIIADAEDGMTGSTSVSWAANNQDLIITTTGGLFSLTAEHAQAAKLIKLSLEN